MSAAGFAEVAVQTVEGGALPLRSRQARERLLELLRRGGEPLSARTADALERLYRTWPAEGGTIAQVFGRRAA
jgi:hypothetical protein